MRCVVMWFRRDLRLADHPALSAAAATGLPVVPLFVVDPAFTSAGAPRREYMQRALRSLDHSTGDALVYRNGDPTMVVPRFAAEVGADSVFVSRDYGPYGRRRDATIAERLRADGRRLAGHGSPYAVAPGSVVKDDGNPYAMFTPFLKRWRTHAVPAPLEVPDVQWLGNPDIACDGTPPALDPVCELPEIGEDAASARWTEFANGPLDAYDECRDVPSIAGTSHLSADLRWGVVHPRQLLADLSPNKAHDTFAAELAWRDFYADLLHRRPDSAWANLDARMDAMQVDTDDDARRRFGAWAAGTGTDAAPYFRVFNPTAQAQRFDPDDAYARRWIPELGTSAYPPPMVDHAAERGEALRRYGLVAGSTR
jgi:deoxyribodipyrimidine photo-lyase